MKVLIVEDNKSERELLKYMLESRFQHTTKFREAADLHAAMSYLSQGDINCVLLDLQLPDSYGKETFAKIQARHPEVPVIVMTNTKDRDLAIELVRMGAADYVVKDFTDEESIFQRILLAIEKHKHSVRVPAEAAADVRRVEQARARLMSAHQSGEHQAIQANTVETTAATADLSRRMFTELQRITTQITSQGRDLKHVTEVTDKLQTEILEGSLDRPSMKSRMDLIERNVAELQTETRIEEKEQTQILTRVSLLENDLDNKFSKAFSDISALKRGKSEETQISAQAAITKMSDSTKLKIAILGLVGTLIAATVGGYFAVKAAEKRAPQTQGGK
jgi:DNA-binding response OmpR family regulator